ncbi:MAG TPA: cupredoxin domain-containing protein [Sphingomonas sp.]|nr:cupredoxin domain-containing protein [Sphingomonas sp.]
MAAMLPGHAQALDHPQPLTIELSSFKFTPSTLTLKRGTAYRIHFVNVSSGGHDFVAKDFFAASTIAPEDRAKAAGGVVDVDGKEAVDITLVPDRSGTYKIRCGHFMHSSFGMTGTINVE